MAEKYGAWKLPWAWDFIIKYLTVPILAGLIVNGVFADATNTESDFYNYPGWVQAVGILSVVLLVLLFAVLAFWPSLWGRYAGTEYDALDDVILEGQMANGTQKSGSKASLIRKREASSDDAA